MTPAPTPTAPILTSAINASFTVNAPGSFNVTATGTPSVFTFGVTGTLPMGVSLNSMTGNLSGTPSQAGMFTVTLSVSNGVAPNASQMFTLNVSKAAQTISFTGPGSQPFNAGSLAVSAFATSGLSVAFASTTSTVCTATGTTVNFVSAGTCTINASQAGNANFNSAVDVAQSFSIGQGTQTLTFGTQMSPLSYAVNGMFGLAPLASASSGLIPTYSSLTQSVCTIAATTVTMLRAGACTIAANQSGNANFSPAAPVTQTITINGIAPGAPALNTATGGDGKITLAFTPPASDGGVSVSSYTANCGGNTAIGSASPITVPGLMNGTSYSCAVTASNGIGMPPASNALMATPNPLPGAALWAAKCGGCHSPAPFGSRLNVGGNTAAVLNYLIDTNVPPAMVPIIGNLTIMTPIERAQLSQYIQEFVPPVTATTPANTAVGIDVTSQIVMNTATVGFTSLEVLTPPTSGTINSIIGTTINYLPNNDFTGTDSFTYRGKQAGLSGDARTVTVTVASAAPLITSALTANGIIGQVFSYQIAATNIPASYNATPLPNGLTVNMSNGQITGMPSAGGSTMVTISAANAGGTGSAVLVINVNLIPQTITFGAQSSPINFVSGGVVMIAPTASGGASVNPIVYSSLTPSVCSAGAGTFTMLSAGVCTIAANQAGNATYAAAAQVTRSVTINGSAPGAPTIGSPTAGNTQATINFTAPVNTGGLSITSYTANCNGIANNGPASPIMVSGLVNGVSYACTVQATNPAGTGPVSAIVMVTPIAIAFAGSIGSRKTHAGIDYDLPLNTMALINGAFTVEPRAIGSAHRIVFHFNNPVNSVTSVTARDANMNPVGTATPSFSGNELIVTLVGVPDNQRLTVTVTGVNGSALTVPVSVGFLIGDVTNNHAVNAADISAVKSRIGPTTGANFMFDLNASGAVSNADVSTAKARSGMVIP